MTPVLRLSEVIRRGTAPKNSNAATCALVHAVWSIRVVGRTKGCLENGSVSTNAHTRWPLPVSASRQCPSIP